MILNKFMEYNYFYGSQSIFKTFEKIELLNPKNQTNNTQNNKIDPSGGYSEG